MRAKGGSTAVKCSSLNTTETSITSPTGASLNGGSICYSGTTNPVKGNDYVIIATQPYNLWVKGIQVSPANRDDVLRDGTVSYNPGDKTLTLDNASFTISSNYGLRNGIDTLRINLVGTNSITASGYGALYTYNNNLIIKGHGTLDLSGELGLFAYNSNVTVEGGCTINASSNSNSYGIYGNTTKSLTITNSKVTAQGASGSASLYGFGSLNLTGCSLTSPSGAVWDATDHRVENANGFAVTAQVIISPISYNISVAGIPVTSANCEDVLRDGDSNNPVTVSYDPVANELTLNRARIYLNTTQGISTTKAGLKINLVDDNVIVSNSTGIYTNQSLVIQGMGTLHVTGSDGIWASGCNLTIQGGCTVEATGTSTSNNAGLYGGNTLTINRSRVVANSADSGRSAIYGFGTLTFTDNKVHFISPANGSYSNSNVRSGGSVYTEQVVIDGTPYYIWIGETQVTSANCDNITSEAIESGTVSYNPTSHTLTLNNATIDATAYEGVTAIEYNTYTDFTIELIGVNHIEGNSGDGNDGIVGYMEPQPSYLTIKGPGELDIHGADLIISGDGNGNRTCNLTFSEGAHVSLDAIYADGYGNYSNKINLNVHDAVVEAGYVDCLSSLSAAIAEPAGAQFNSNVSNGCVALDGERAENVILCEGYGLTVGGTQVTSFNASNVQCDGLTDGVVSYDAASHTLTLDNVNISLNNTIGISSTIAGLTIALIGENNIVTNSSGIYTNVSSLTIAGPEGSSLYVTGSDGMYVLNCDLTIQGGCEVTTIGTNSGPYSGIYGSNNKCLTISQSTLHALCNVASSTSAISGFSSLTLDDVEFLEPANAIYSTQRKHMEDPQGNLVSCVEIGYAEYDLWICYERVTSANASHIVDQYGNITGSVSYDRYTNTLTLNGATIGGQAENGITNRIDGLTIRLIGYNTINSWGESLDNDGANLTIQGTGTLTLEDSYSGIDAYNMDGKNLIIKDGCVVNIEHGVTYVDGGTLIVSNATLQSNGSGSNVVVSDNLILDYVKISTPSNAVFNAETHRVEDANGNPVTGHFVIEPIKYDLWVAGTQVTAYNAANITGAGISGNVSYDAGNNVLTLNNANLICLEDPDPEIDDPDGIRNEDVADLTIQLVGNNTIQAGDDGINMARHTTITGGGTLNVTAPYGIYDGTSSGTDVVIADGCCINVTSTTYGICSNGSITVRNAEIKTTGNNNGSLRCKQLTLEGCSITSPSGAVWNSSTHFVENQGAVVKSQVVIEPIQYNLRVAGIQVTTANASNITGPGITSGMVSYDATSNTLTLRDAEITASAEAIENRIPNLSIVVEGVNNLSSDHYGVRSYANFSIEGGGVLNIWSENNGIRADNSSLTISGGCTVHTYHVGSGLYPAMAVSFTLTVDGSTLIIDPISNIICPMSCGSYELVGTEFSQPVPATLGSDGRIYSNGNLYTGQIVIEPIKYDLYVAGTQVTSVNAANVLGDGSVSYNASTQTLTLSYANIVYTDGEVNESNGIYNAGIDGLKIVLEGANSITAGDAGILTDVETEITGIGTLNISAPWGIYGDWSDSKLTLSEGCMVQVEASTLGVDVVSLTVDKSTLVASGNSGSVRTDDLDLVGASIYLPVQAEWDEEGDGYVIENGVTVTSQVVISILQYDLWVADTRVNAVNAANILGEGIISGSVSYDEVTNTLTLDNAYIFYEVEGYGNYLGGIITKCDNLTINLVGNNTIYTGSSDDSDNGILIYGTNTTFTGQGTLDIGSSHGIWCFHNNLDDTRTFDLTFNGGCDVEVYQSDCGIYLNDLGKLNVDHASVSVYQPTACGIYLEQEPELVGTEILFPRGGYWNGHQIVDPNGSATQSVTINPCNVFLGTIDSSWDVEGNWSNDILPDIYSKVHIAAPCVSDDNIQVREIVIDDLGSLNLVNDAVLTVDNIVNDDPAKFVITYGQLYCDNEVVGTFHKNITMAGSDATGWYTIAVPMNNPSIANLTTGTYDLYAYDEDADQQEWQNHKDNPFSLVPGLGYLYANSATTDLVMTGTFRPSNRMLTKSLSYGAQYEGIRGFNLIGNPFPHNITMINVKVNGEPISEFYILNNSGELQLFNQGDDVILPGQGFFIKATGPNQKVTIEGE